MKDKGGSKYHLPPIDWRERLGQPKRLAENNALESVTPCATPATYQARGDSFAVCRHYVQAEVIRLSRLATPYHMQTLLSE